MSTRGWGILAIVLAIVILVLALLLFATPAAAPIVSPQATTSSEAIVPTPVAASTSTLPLDTQVVVTTPQSGAAVSRTFEVAGIAPNQWFFEAVFPIQVRDPNDNLIGSSQGKAQGDWTQQGPVTFTSQVTIDSSYEGPANLILLKDNPSGLPQNADEVTIPIVIH